MTAHKRDPGAYPYGAIIAQRVAAPRLGTGGRGFRFANGTPKRRPDDERIVNVDSVYARELVAVQRRPPR
jgi:hypothetical protein